MSRSHIFSPSLSAPFSLSLSLFCSLSYFVRVSRLILLQLTTGLFLVEIVVIIRSLFQRERERERARGESAGRELNYNKPNKWKYRKKKITRRKNIFFLSEDHREAEHGKMGIFERVARERGRERGREREGDERDERG